MLNITYYTSIRAYRFGISIAKLFGNEKAKKWVEGRNNWKKELVSFRKKNIEQSLIWFHASSLGEFEQVKPLIEKIKQDKVYEDYVLFVTFFSPSGYENSLDYTVADKHFYLPLDTQSNASFFIETLQPDLAIFVKYDFWFNILNTLQEYQVPTIYFSCNFRAEQIYFKSYSKWQLSILEHIDKIFTLNEKSKKVLDKYNFSAVEVCGDTRYDKVIQTAERKKSFPTIKAFKDNSPLLIIGSSWQPEEKIIAKYIKETKNHLKIIIAPHDIAEKHLIEIEKLIEEPTIRYSRLNEENAIENNILLIDNIGMLASLYQYSNFAFIGGGFTNDLHNILEPAAFENIVFYGNKFSKYPEGQELIDFGGGISVKSFDDFKNKMDSILLDKKMQFSMRKKSKEFIYRHKGATNIVYQAVKNLL